MSSIEVVVEGLRVPKNFKNIKLGIGESGSWFLKEEPRASSFTG